MTDLIWHNEKRKIKDLIVYNDNPRVVTEAKKETLKQSVTKFNLVETPVIDTNNTIVAGHQRIDAMMQLGRGEEEIDVRVPNRPLTSEEFVEYNLRSNISIGEWNYDLLKSIDQGILLTSGIDKFDLSHIFNETISVEDDGFDVAKTIEKIGTNPFTKPGDLILLGNNHRLACIDSQDPKAVERLVGDSKISMLNFDPIYNIDYDYDGGLSKNGKYGGSTEDSKTDEEYKEFLKRIFKNGMNHLLPDAHVFCFCDQRYIGLIQSLYQELGITNRRVCLWIKNSQNPTPQIAFSKAYEPCVYGTIGKPYLSDIKNLNEIMNHEISTGNRLCDDILDLLDIWIAKRVAGQSYTHPTEKPNSLYEKSLKRCSKPGDIILDLFAGSGALMSAAEQLGRKVFMAEIDPIFCDVIVARYKELTGKEAVYVNSEK